MSPAPASPAAPKGRQVWLQVVLVQLRHVSIRLCLFKAGRVRQHLNLARRRRLLRACAQQQRRRPGERPAGDSAAQPRIATTPRWQRWPWAAAAAGGGQHQWCWAPTAAGCPHEASATAAAALLCCHGPCERGGDAQLPTGAPSWPSRRGCTERAAARAAWPAAAPCAHAGRPHLSAQQALLQQAALAMSRAREREQQQQAAEPGHGRPHLKAITCD